MTEVIEYQAGESIRFTNEYADSDEADYDPDTIEIKVYDPLGVLKKTVTYVAAEIIKDSIGHYYYDYLIPSDGAVGMWDARWTATSGSQPVIDPGQFVVAPVDLKLYCTAEQAISRAGMDPTNSGVTLAETRDFVRGAMGEIDQLHQRTYSYDNDVTEWFDTQQSDRNVAIDTIFLDSRPVLSVTSVVEYNVNNALVKTHSSDDYWVDLETGRIILTDNEFSHQPHRIKVVYKSGYAQVPAEISALAAVMAGLSVLDSAIGGSTSDVTNYTVGGMSVAIGETYAVMRVAREKLEMTYKRMTKNIGNRRGDVMI